MDPAFAAHTQILARRKKPKKAKPEKLIPTAGRDLNERALSKAAADAREPGAPEPDEEEEDWYTTALAIEASAQNGAKDAVRSPVTHVTREAGWRLRMRRVALSA